MLCWQAHKEGVLKDGSRVNLRPMVKEDREKLMEFFRGWMPEN